MSYRDEIAVTDCRDGLNAPPETRWDTFEWTLDSVESWFRVEDERSAQCYDDENAQEEHFEITIARFQHFACHQEPLRLFAESEQPKYSEEFEDLKELDGAFFHGFDIDVTLNGQHHEVGEHRRDIDLVHTAAEEDLNVGACGA